MSHHFTLNDGKVITIGTSIPFANVITNEVSIGVFPKKRLNFENVIQMKFDKLKI